MTAKTKKDPTVSYGDITFKLLPDEYDTLAQVSDLKAADIRAIYAEVTGDDRPAKQIDITKATKVVQLALTIRWYRTKKRKAPPTDITKALAEAQQMALATSTKDETKGTPKRLIKDVLMEGIKAGLDTDAILENVRDEFPSCTTDHKDVAWYRWKMRKDGDLPPVERKPKTAKPKAKKAKAPAKKGKGKNRPLARKGKAAKK